jgi:hypothetical protein
MEEFFLSIHRGNDAVQSPRDIAGLLRKTADEVEVLDFSDMTPYQLILDDNGNVVGRYEMRYDRDYKPRR